MTNMAGHLGALHGMTCALDNCNTGLLAPKIVAGWLCDSHNTSANGAQLRRDDSGRLMDTAGAYGYSAHFTGAYVCYSCGHMCECSELYGDPDNTCTSCGVIDPSGIEILHLTTCALV